MIIEVTTTAEGNRSDHRFRKKYGELNSASAITKLELNTLIVPRISNTIMITMIASKSFVQNFLRSPSAGALFFIT